MKAFATVLVLAAAALTLTACGSSSSESTTSSTSTSSSESGAAPESAKSSESGAAEPGGGPVVSAKAVSGLGTVLVDSEGKTLYMFAPDNKSKVTCTESCASVWPPLKAEAGEEAEASGGVKASLLGTDPDPEGGEVVTYAGWPLYTYVADTGPGSANGQGVNLNGGYWYVITPAGKIVK
ncbi:MAG TPA: hypothetical protein VGI44_08525 [Acidimicrobiales bacterium]|jgi:predicted lipoprotein with Yx(FWY)xxD motif